jgi:hypothetical protein
MKKGRLIFNICALCFMLVTAIALIIVLVNNYIKTGSIDLVIASECLGILTTFIISLVFHYKSSSRLRLYTP